MKTGNISRLKKGIFLLLAVMLLAFTSCETYSDGAIRVKLTEPDANGLIEYQAGISEKENAVRLTQLTYRFSAVENGMITVRLPQTVTSEAGKVYPIKQFGGPRGSNAPMERFTLLIDVEHGTMPTEPIVLAVDAGALPLDTFSWNDVRILFYDTEETAEISVEDVVFSTDAPIAYYLSLEYKDEGGEITNAWNSEHWYERPEMYQTGGGTVTVKVKHPKGDIQRKLYLHYDELEPIAVCDGYTVYEFVMPYHDTGLTISDYN